MKPGRYNGFRFTQGDTWSTAPVWKISGTPVNVSGYTAKMQIRKSATSGTVVFEFSTANGRITTGTSDGKFTLLALPADTANVAGGTYVYDFDVTAPDGTNTTLLSGTFQVIPQVSQ